MVEIDDLRPERATSQRYICHVNSAGIFPVQWSLKNGLHLSPPPGTSVQPPPAHPSAQDNTWAKQPHAAAQEGSGSENQEV